MRMKMNECLDFLPLTWCLSPAFGGYHYIRAALNFNRLIDPWTNGFEQEDRKVFLKSLTSLCSWLLTLWNPWINARQCKRYRKHHTGLSVSTLVKTLGNTIVWLLHGDVCSLLTPALLYKNQRRLPFFRHIKVYLCYPLSSRCVFGRRLWSSGTSQLCPPSLWLRLSIIISHFSFFL